MEFPKPSPEHEWLRQLIGDWEYEFTFPDCPLENPPIQTGIERVRPLGEYWITTEINGQLESDGQVLDATALSTIGFDPLIGKFIGSTVSSGSRSWYRYEGELDETRRILTLHTEGPSITHPEIVASYRDHTEIIDPDTKISWTEAWIDEGRWLEITRGTMRRVK